MSCLPGMPCYPIGPVYPEGMGPCTPVIPCLDASFVNYQGPNLPCTGVNTGDNLEIALQKIDTVVCPENMLTQIIQLLQVNPELRYQFCQLVNGCTPTTTTTTTTAAPYYTFNLAEGIDAPTACAAYPGGAQPFYLDNFLLTIGTSIYTDSSLTTPVADGYYSDGTTAWVVTGGSGLITNGVVC